MDHGSTDDDAFHHRLAHACFAKVESRALRRPPLRERRLAFAVDPIATHEHAEDNAGMRDGDLAQPRGHQGEVPGPDGRSRLAQDCNEMDATGLYAALRRRRKLWVRSRPTCLDGCAIFFRRDSCLAFDTETFDGFHCVGEDVALAARVRGIPLVIPHAHAEHASSSNFPPGADHTHGQPAWLRDYSEYCNRLKRKYPQLEYILS